MHGPAHHRAALVNLLSCTLFVPTGLMTVLLGPLLPFFISRWALTDTQAGYLVTAQFLGSMSGTLASGRIVSRLAFKGTLVLAVAFMAIGAGLLLSGPYLVAVAAVFCYGIGIGVGVPTANLLVAQAAGESRASMLNLLNFFWSAGAVACPFLLSPFLSSGRVARFLLLLAALLVALLIAFAVAPLRAPAPVNSPAPTPRLAIARAPWPLLLVLGALFFLYVGSETAFGAWLAAYTQRSIVGAAGAWVTVPAFFYGAILIGRLAASSGTLGLSDIAQARLGALLATASVVAILFARTFVTIAAATTLIGLGMSILYPIAIAVSTARLGDAAPRVMGFLFALSTLGGATVPWLVGFISTSFGGLRLALIVPLVGCCVVSALFWSPSLVHTPRPA